MLAKTDEIGDRDDQPSKPKRGRPRGQKKTGGRQKSSPHSWSDGEAREILLERSQSLATLADIAAGRPMRVTGPTGKAYDKLPDIEQRLRASSVIADKVLPSARFPRAAIEEAASLAAALIEANLASQKEATGGTPPPAAGRAEWRERGTIK